MQIAVVMVVVVVLVIVICTTVRLELKLGRPCKNKLQNSGNSNVLGVALIDCECDF